MIWLKRLLPLLVLGMAVGGYVLWDRWNSEKRSLEENRLALVTAQVWIATARYRYDPERFVAYRDSLLQAESVPREKVLEFLNGRENQPEDLLPFAQKVQKCVDSLYRIEDSIVRQRKIDMRDSVRAAAQSPVDLR
ncbi:MAG: hypothetical protein AB1772_01820 [Candidatus Zixiibacteriota bacterium]